MKMLDDLIDRCDVYLRDLNTCDSNYLIQLFADTCIMCSKVLEEKTGYVIKEQAIMAGITYADVRTLRKALESCREQYEHELAVSGASAAKVRAIAHAEAAASVDFSVSQTISMVWDVPEEALSSGMKAEISKLLKELEAEKEPSRLAKAAKAAADFVFDKAIEAAPAVLPCIAQAIRAALPIL